MTPDRHKHTNEHPAELTETEMRQGGGQLVNFRVLLFSLLIAVIAGLLLWSLFYGLSPTLPSSPSGPT